MSTAHAIPTELGTEKIGKLLKSYAGPAIIAMVASSLYNIIDSIFIGHGVGSLAISGLAVTFPLMNLSAACGTLVGVGASTILAVLLGQQNYDAANKVLGNIVSLNTIIGALFSVVALIFLDPILYFFGASENTIVYAREYMQVILAGNIITHLYLGLNNALRTSGKPKLAMGLTISTVVLNVILAPLFIFVLDMGIRGAALATVIAQFAVVMVISGRTETMKAGTAVMTFFLYAILTGVTFSVLFIAYAPTAIAKAFISAASVFVGASIYGSFSKSNVRSWGRFLFMALFGLVIATFINMFFYSTAMDLLISAVGVVLFTGLTVWDTNKIVAMNREFGGQISQADYTKLGILGALDLYLDFINIFLYLLRFVGHGNRD